HSITSSHYSFSYPARTYCPDQTCKRLPFVQGSVSKETAIATHSALSGLSPQKEKRLRDLYERLDMDNDGTVDIRDLTAALKHEMPHIPTRLAPKLMARLSSRNEDKVDFGEFVKYIVEHEKRLEAIFQDLDKNNDGKLLCREQCVDVTIPIGVVDHILLSNQGIRSLVLLYS
ncbi:unnamed protein product, partial [Haemonchus placei]|uniref:Calmodulin n=1 Tax=Haemonchus placei TaxID=6290 RepID=A0A0N4X069_HAEPC